MTARIECCWCHRKIRQARSGTWYHVVTASASCRPGWASWTAWPKVVSR